MRFVLIPLDFALPAVQAYVGARGDEPLEATDVQGVAEVLERCVKTSEALILFALRTTGRPCLH